MQVGSITIVAQGETAEQLLACLRDKVDKFNVAVAPAAGDHVHVNDRAGGIKDLQAFPDHHLNECAQTLGVPDWSRHLLVDPAG